MSTDMDSINDPTDHFERSFERIETPNGDGTTHIGHRLTDAESAQLCAGEPLSPDVADWSIAPYGAEAFVPYLPDVTGLTNAEAAEAYAQAGIRIVPIRPGTKNPGSYLRNGWPQRATCDLDTVRDWWRRWPDAGIAMHVGASGLLVIDVDHPERVPTWLWPLLDEALFRPTTNDSRSRRGHYFFRLEPGRRFGCGLGGLNPPKGEKWGDVKSWGGAVVLGPTVHPRRAEGGRYTTGPAGTISFLPRQIADKLNEAPDPETCCPLSPRELDANAKRFLDAYADDREPYALDPITDNFDPTPGGRHGRNGVNQPRPRRRHSVEGGVEVPADAADDCRTRKLRNHNRNKSG